MKVEDVIRITEPDFLPVKIEQIQWWPCCDLGKDIIGGDCDDCEFSEEEGCDYYARQSTINVVYEGRCEDVPIKLGKKKVEHISADTRSFPKHKQTTSLDGVTLLIRITEEKQ